MRLYWFSALLAFLLATGTPLPVQGQGADFGVKGGVTVMTNGGDDAKNASGYRTGFLAGGFATISVVGPLSAQPELIYIRKGAAVSEGGYTLTRKLDYIEIPVLARVRLAEVSLVDIHALAGPSVGFNLKAEQTSGYLPGNIRTTEFGLETGAGGALDFDAGTLSIEVRYELGLNSIEEYSGDFVRNQGFMVATGFTF